VNPAASAAPPALQRVPDEPALVTTVAPSGRDRLVSLDVFRGLTIAGMLLVNNPGSWANIYPPLRHADWHGWTPTDLIFPFFLFIVGITTWISLEGRRARGADEGELLKQIVRRGAVIFLLGLLLNAFPFEPTRIANIRVMGVLQRIGLAYMLGALLAFRTSWRQQLAIIATLLVGYFALMTLVPVPGQEAHPYLLLDTKDGNLAAWVDRAVFTERHLWSGSRTWDPEGLLSTIPAIGTVLLGILAGRWIAMRKPLAERIAGLFAAGSVLMVAGLMWNWVFPINKPLWTSSYVLFTAGMGAATLATCMWVIDHYRITWWTKPFVIYGVNPIIAFVGSGMMARLIYSIVRVPYQGETISLQAAIYRSVYASWLPPRFASLMFALSFVTLWLGILWVLYRRRVFLKV
jgi:predicted acyltransferase